MKDLFKGMRASEVADWEPVTEKQLLELVIEENIRREHDIRNCEHELEDFKARGVPKYNSILYVEVA
jgi:hypothetical protein